MCTCKYRNKYCAWTIKWSGKLYKTRYFNNYWNWFWFAGCYNLLLILFIFSSFLHIINCFMMTKYLFYTDCFGALYIPNDFSDLTSTLTKISILLINSIQIWWTVLHFNDNILTLMPHSFCTSTHGKSLRTTGNPSVCFGYTPKTFILRGHIHFSTKS